MPKKIYSVLVAAAASTLPLTACGGGGASSEHSTSAASSTPSETSASSSSETTGAVTGSPSSTSTSASAHSVAAAPLGPSTRVCDLLRPAVVSRTTPASSVSMRSSTGRCVITFAASDGQPATSWTLTQMRTTVSNQVAAWRAERPDTTAGPEFVNSDAKWLHSTTAPEMSAVVWTAKDGFAWELKKDGMATRAHASDYSMQINKLITAN